MSKMRHRVKGAASHKKQVLTPKDEVLGWLLMSMLYAPHIQEMRTAALSEVGGISPDATDKLERLGCRRSTLITTAVIGTLAHRLYPPISAERFREIAKKIRSTVWGINEIVPQVLVPHGQLMEDGSLEVEWQPAGGDMQLEPWIETRLLEKASMFESLAEMCTAKEVPTRAEFARVGHIWPLVYVEAKTGQPHYSLVARLLQETRTKGEVSGRRLRDSYISIKQNHSETLRWLLLATSNLEAREDEGKMVLFAFADGQKDTVENPNESDSSSSQ